VITEKSTVAAYVDWRDRQHKARQQGPKENLGQALFDSLNLYCQSHHCWLISPPGLRHVMIEAPSGSNVAADLSGMGFRVSPAGFGSRLVPHAGQENLERNRYKPARMVSHAGEIATDLFEIILPKT
jgi:hypothetical protein